MGAALAGEHGAGHFLGRGFADRSCDGEDAGLGAGAGGFAKLFEGCKHIGHDEKRQGEKHDHQPLVLPDGNGVQERLQRCPVDGGDLRADLIASKDEAITASLGKARVIIDENGDRLWKGDTSGPV